MPPAKDGADRLVNDKNATIEKEKIMERAIEFLAGSLLMLGVATCVIQVLFGASSVI